MPKRLVEVLRVSFAVGLVCLASLVAAATAVASGPKLEVSLGQWPNTTVAPETLLATIGIHNGGDQASHGPIVFSDTTSPGLSFQYLFTELPRRAVFTQEGPTTCETVNSTFTCTYYGSIPAGAQVVLFLFMQVAPQASGALANSISVSGGGMAGSSQSEWNVTVGPPEPFGFSEAAVSMVGRDGTAETQAASVPTDYTTTLHWRAFASKLLGVITSVAGSGRIRMSWRTCHPA